MSIFLPAQDPKVSKRRRRNLVVVGIFALLLVAAAKPVMTSVNKFRARKLVASAEAYFAQGRRAEALEVGRAALNAGAEGARAHAVLLRTLASENKPEAFYFWAKLANATNISVEQRRELARCAVAWRQADLAETQWRLLVKEDSESAETLRIGAMLCELTGDAFMAVRYAQKALAGNPDDFETRMVLARVLVNEGQPRDRAIGKRLLLEAAQRGDSAAVYALRLLSGVDELTAFEAGECARWLGENSGRETVDVLTEAMFEARVRPYKRESILTSAADQFLEQKGSMAELARWFSRHRLFEELVMQVPEAEALKQAETFLLFVDGLGAMGRWKDVERLLTTDGVPVDELTRSLYLARVATQGGEARIAELRWRQALEIAGKEGRSLVKVADYARRSGAMDIARAACEQMISQKGNVGRRGFVELLKVHARDLRAAREVLKRLVAEFPGEAVAENDLAYAELLLGADGSELLPKVERMAKGKQGFVAFQATRALALLRAGNFDAAKKAFPIGPERWRELLPYQQAVYAAALSASGEKNLARQIFEEIDATQLRAEERKLMEDYL